jgi:hypothetical protein
VDKSETSKDTDWAPTDVTLPVKICLARGSIGTREFPVDLVLDIAHGDKSGHDTIPAARLHWIEEISGSSGMRMTLRTYCGNFSVMHVTRGGYSRSSIALGKHKGKLSTT